MVESEQGGRSDIIVEINSGAQYRQRFNQHKSTLQDYVQIDRAGTTFFRAKRIERTFENDTHRKALAQCKNSKNHI